MTICISTVVDKTYMAYAPMFVWCCKQVYPSYDIKLFLRDPCPYDLTGAEVIPLFEKFPRYVYNSIALRFVVPPKYYEGYDHVYVGDIDIMIMPERIALDEFHRNEMVTTGLSYSNSLRNIHHYCGYQSVSGLHFASKHWFDQTEEQRAIYYRLLERGLIGLYREYDGLMLYRMIEKSGLKLPAKLKLKKRHHGIHLGNFRLFSSKEKIAERIPVDYRSQWQEWCGNPEFTAILKRSREDNSELDYQVTALDEFIRRPKDE